MQTNVLAVGSLPTMFASVARALQADGVTVHDFADFPAAMAADPAVLFKADVRYTAGHVQVGAAELMRMPRLRRPVSTQLPLHALKNIHHLLRGQAPPSLFNREALPAWSARQPAA